MNKDKFVKMFEFLNEHEQRKYPLRALLELCPEKFTEADLENFEDPLDLSEIKLDRLPSNMVFHGFVDLSSSALIEYPDNVLFLKGVDLSFTKISKLPDNLELEGLNLTCTLIKKLPKNLFVHDYLYLGGTKIKEVPSDLRVGKYLSLHNSAIRKLPKDWVLNCRLDLSNTRITELPQNMTVDGELDLSYLSVKKLPDGLKATTLVLNGIKNIELGENIDIKCLDLEVDYFKNGNPAIIECCSELSIRDFDYQKQKSTKALKNLAHALTNTKNCQSVTLELPHIPSNFSYNGNLVIDSSELKYCDSILLDNVTIGKELVIDAIFIKHLSKNIKATILTFDCGWISATKNDELMFNYDDYIESIRAYLKEFKCEEIKLKWVPYLPDNLTINANCTIYSPDLTKLPDNLTVYGDLNILDTEVSDLPESLNVKGKVYFSISPLS